MPKKSLSLIFASGIFLLFVDQILKRLSLDSFHSSHTWRGLIGWDPFLNSGVAFSLPIPNWLTIVITIPIILLITWFIYSNCHPEQREGSSNYPLSLVLILIGAISNLVDRLTVHHTIDYIRIFTLIFNLADVYIVAGVVLYLLMKKKHNCHPEV